MLILVKTPPASARTGLGLTGKERQTRSHEDLSQSWMEFEFAADGTTFTRTPVWRLQNGLLALLSSF